MNVSLLLLLNSFHFVLDLGNLDGGLVVRVLLPLFDVFNHSVAFLLPSLDLGKNFLLHSSHRSFNERDPACPFLISFRHLRDHQHTAFYPDDALVDLPILNDVGKSNLVQSIISGVINLLKLIRYNSNQNVHINNCGEEGKE